MLVLNSDTSYPERACPRPNSRWRTTDQNRRAKYYELTPAGRKALGAEAESWRRYVDMVDLILRTT